MMIITMKRIQKVDILKTTMMTITVGLQMNMMTIWMKERLLETFMNMRQSITIFLTVGNMRESFLNYNKFLPYFWEIIEKLEEMIMKCF